ncbi:head-tail connector protein [Bacillus manliponensis]|uniref:head-tail connector protein n=1 Tax=Bacillus manliponensis TaxID=574376 RepID=UPI003513623E
MSLLEKVKNAMRIDGVDHDDELQDLIDTAKHLLKEAGVVESKNVDTDPLIRKAVITYCKAQFGTDTKDSERFSWSFEEMKKHLSLLQSYTMEDAL